MITLISNGAGFRYRAVVPQSLFESAPVEARDLSVPGRVYWAQPVGQADPFTAGALWGLSWSLDLVFGSIAGPLLTGLTLSNVERWNGQDWTVA